VTLLTAACITAACITAACITAACINVGPDAPCGHECLLQRPTRKKIVAATEQGMPTVGVARAFGVGLSSVKRHAKTGREREKGDD